LLKAIDEVLRGNRYLSPEITDKVISRYSADIGQSENKTIESQFSKLSPREREILKLIAEGNSNSEIGSILFISDQTVKTHRANLMKKLDIHNLADLIKYAMKNGLID